MRVPYEGIEGVALVPRFAGRQCQADFATVEARYVGTEIRCETIS